jgi:hypothetical protein
MKSNDPIHNPFYNRFNDPVRRRHDDLQAHEYTLWLKERNRVLPPRVNSSEVSSKGGRVAGALVLVVVLLISAGVLLRGF